MIKPGQASDTLDIPPSTLRRLANEFEDYLSPQTGRFREYTLEDLDTFRRIRELLSHGMTYEDVKTRLQVLEKPSEDQEVKDLAIVPELIKSLQIASDQLATLQAKSDDQDKRIKALEAWLALPWYRKLFTKPPQSV
jgi:DNA-binding transcriptional MerR regulator